MIRSRGIGIQGSVAQPTQVSQQPLPETTLEPPTSESDDLLRSSDLYWDDERVLAEIQGFTAKKVQQLLNPYGIKPKSSRSEQNHQLFLAQMPPDRRKQPWRS